MTNERAQDDTPRRAERRGASAWFCGRMAFLYLALGLACTPPPALERSPEVTRAGVVFRYRDPVAHLVQISGSWQENFQLRGLEWTRDTRVGLMERRDDGVWELRVPLGPGRYEYLFLVDGRFWELDPANPQRAPDGRSGFVSLCVVP